MSSPPPPNPIPSGSDTPPPGPGDTSSPPPNSPPPPVETSTSTPPTQPPPVETTTTSTPTPPPPTTDPPTTDEPDPTPTPTPSTPDEPDPTPTPTPTDNEPEPTPTPTNPNTDKTSSTPKTTSTPRRTTKQTTIVETITSFTSDGAGERPVTFTTSRTTSYGYDLEQPTDPPTSGGLQGGGKIAVAVAVPIFGVALLAVAALFFWKRHKRQQNEAAERRKEVEEYGYNPNSDTRGSPGETGSYEMAESSSSGYRGWGSTQGRTRAGTTGAGTATSHSGSGTGRSPVIGVPYSDYAANTKPGADPFATPVTSSPTHRPATGESSTMGAMGPPGAAAGAGGLARGTSNASSNYSAFAHSDHSDPNNNVGQAIGGGPNDRYYGHPGPAGYYDDGGYDPTYDESAPPIIRDVDARRNTRIETPTQDHFPQETRGIAQNF